jgi:cytochrome c oxidase subunit 3
MSIIKTLMTKPWEDRPGTVENLQGGVISMPPERIGLWTFLAVATSVFGLFIVAYNFRLELDDWVSVPKPLMLWLNSALLILASIALQWARVASSEDRLPTVKVGLIAGGLFSLAFIGGQLIAWRQLTATGYFMTANPANSFFYLITALHGVHVLGGLWVWAKTSYKVLRGSQLEDVRLSVELCTVYWHYLLIVWAVLFGLLLST